MLVAESSSAAFPELTTTLKSSSTWQGALSRQSRNFQLGNHSNAACRSGSTQTREQAGARSSVLPSPSTSAAIYINRARPSTFAPEAQRARFSCGDHPSPPASFSLQKGTAEPQAMRSLRKHFNHLPSRDLGA